MGAGAMSGKGQPSGGKGQPQGQQGQQGQQYTPGTFGPQNPQGAMALQNAYQQFQNGAPPQPNPMFGQQPMGHAGDFNPITRHFTPGGAPLGGGMAQQPMGHAGDFNPITRHFTPGGAPLGGGTPYMQSLPQQGGQQQGLPQYPQPVFNPSTQQAQLNQAYQDFARQQQMGGGMPMAPATQQTRPEDPRMAAMRYMQQMKLGGR